jgi:zinc/manganese transport system permease protein
MTEAVGFLWPSFLVAVCLVGIHAYFGIQVLARNVIFVDLALAQIAALGATVAFMLGHPAQGPATYGYSLGFTLLAAVLLALTRAWAVRVPQEALIGVIYVVAAAASILLIDRAPQGAEHLKQILTGNILTSGVSEIAVIVPLYLAVALVHFFLRGKFAKSGSLFWEFVFYATFGMVVTSSVALAGVLLVFSFLIIPAAIGVMYASSLPRQLAIGWIAGIVTSAAGFAASFAFDLPTGAAIVCAFGAALALAGLVYPFVRGDRAIATKIAISSLRWIIAAVIAGSAIQLAVAPRADQPLIDTLETTIPSLRNLYFTSAEAAAYQDAVATAERHRLAAEQLIEQEKRSRTQGAALDEMTVQRMSSFLKSYAEMRKGEQFVMGEVRARARQRIRWIVSPALLAIALMLAPLPWRRLVALAK